MRNTNANIYPFGRYAYVHTVRLIVCLTDDGCKGVVWVHVGCVWKRKGNGILQNGDIKGKNCSAVTINPEEGLL